MPTYSKFMKDVLTRKRRIDEFETVALTEEACKYLTKIPPKLKDPGVFTIPCTIGKSYLGRALCDLGSSINLMPASIFKQLDIGDARPTTVSVQLADRSIAKPEGKIENILVQVDKFILPADLLILDFEADQEVPIILGRPFLATGNAVINVKEGELSMSVNGEEVKFNVMKAMSFNDDNTEECSGMTLIDQIIAEKQEEILMTEVETEEFEELEELVASMEQIQPWSMKRESFEPLNRTEQEQPKKPSLEQPPLLELKPLPEHLKYIYLGNNNTLPVIISSLLTHEQESQLTLKLKEFKEVIGWTMADIKGINPTICMHKILLQDPDSSSVEHQRRMNPNMKEVVRKEEGGSEEGGCIDKLNYVGRNTQMNYMQDT